MRRRPPRSISRPRGGGRGLVAPQPLLVLMRGVPMRKLLMLLLLLRRLLVLVVVVVLLRLRVSAIVVVISATASSSVAASTATPAAAGAVAWRVAGSGLVHGGSRVLELGRERSRVPMVSPLRRSWVSLLDFGGGIRESRVSNG